MGETYTRITLEVKYPGEVTEKFVAETDAWDLTLDDLANKMEGIMKAAGYSAADVEEIFHPSCSDFICCPPDCEETDDVFFADKPSNDWGDYPLLETETVKDPEGWACFGCTEACEDTACLEKEKL